MELNYNDMETRYRFESVNREAPGWDDIYLYDDDRLDDRAAKLGIGPRGYDTALPQDWVDDFYKVTGLYPCGQFVWSYQFGQMFGYPAPLTEEAVEALRRYQAVAVLR